MNLLDGLLGALALLFVLVVPGYLTARALWRDTTPFSSGEKFFLPLAVGALLVAWWGLVLAELGFFSLGLLALILVLWSIGAWLVGPRRPLLWWGREELRPDWIFLSILALGALLMLRPAEYILGGYDAGTYVNIGANIARTGAIAIHDPLLQSMPADPARQFLLDLVNPYMLYKQLRLPGFFVADNASGLVLPQFLHLYPVWLALFDAALGLGGGLYATPILGLISSVACYFVARALFGRGIARLSFFLLVISVPQFWFARYPVSEMMMQFLLALGMYAFLRARGLAFWGRERGVDGIGLPIVAGVAFALVFFTRADSVLILAPIGAYALVVIFLREWRRAHWAFFGALGAVFAHAALHIWVFSPDYVYFQYTHFLRMKNIDKVLYSVTGSWLPSAQDFVNNPLYLLPLVLLGVVGLLAVFVLDRLVQVFRKRLSALPHSSPEKGGANGVWKNGGHILNGLRWGGVVVLVALFVYAYFIAPHPTSLYAFVGGETTTSRAGNLIKLGWYLAPIGMILAVLGGCLALRRDLNRQTAFFYGASALFAVFYLEELYSNPHYIYTTRHYIPLVIPLLLLLAARALAWLWRELPQTWPRLGPLARGLAVASLGLWLLYNTYAMGLVDASRAAGVALRLPLVNESVHVGPVRLDPLSRSVVGGTELNGAVAQIDALARALDPRTVIIFVANRDDPTKIATPLRYLYGIDALVARFNQPNGDKIAGLIDAWRAEGRPVVLAYGTNGGKLSVARYALQPLGHFALDVPQLAFAYQYMPRDFWQVNLNYALYAPVPQTAPVSYPYTVDFSGDDFPALVNGWLERTTGEQSRWMGIIPELGSTVALKAVPARLRLPLAGDSAELYLSLTARAPQDGTRLLVKSGKAQGEAQIARNWQVVYFTLKRADLLRDGDSFFLDLTTPAVTDAAGRIVGAEFLKLSVSDQPIPSR